MADGLYGPVQAWDSGQGWFDALMDTLNTPEGHLARAGLVSVGTLLMVARADWLAADADTGRNLTTSHETVAQRTGICKRQVQRARAVIEQLGFAVTILYGRYLTGEERTAAQQVHGDRQDRAASVRALTLPKPSPVDTVHLPTPRRGVRLSPVLKPPPRRASTPGGAASRPGLKTMNKSRPPQADPSRARSGPRPLALQALAGHLVARMPWLARHRHIGALCDILTRCGIEPARWNAGQLVGAVNTWLATTTITVADPARQRDPLGYYVWMIRQAIQPGQPTVAEAAATRRLKLRAEAAARRTHEAALRERITAQADAINATLEQMHADYPRTPHRPARGSTR